MKSKKLGFITGYPRGGTTYTAQMLKNLDKHIFCLWEGRLFFGDDITSLYDRTKEGIRPWYEWIAHRKNNWLNTNNIIETVEKKNFINENVLEEHLNLFTIRTTSCVVRDLMYNAANESNATYVINKDPVSKPGTLWRLVQAFHNSKIIFVKRNIKDVIVSSALTNWRYKINGGIGIDPLKEADVIQTRKFLNGESDMVITEDTAVLMAQNLSSIYMEALSFRKNFPENFKIFYYEDLYKKPIVSLKNICDFLEIEPTGNEINNALIEAGAFNFEKNQEKAVIGNIKMDGSEGKSRLLGEKINTLIDELMEVNIEV